MQMVPVLAALSKAGYSGSHFVTVEALYRLGLLQDLEDIDQCAIVDLEHVI